jgi:hypothetical protein
MQNPVFWEVRAAFSLKRRQAAVNQFDFLGGVFLGCFGSQSAFLGKRDVMPSQHGTE